MRCNFDIPYRERARQGAPCFLLPLLEKGERALEEIREKGLG